MKNVLEIWKNYNNQIDEDDNKMIIENMNDSNKNKINNKSLKKEPKNDLNMIDDNNKNEIEEFEEQQKEIDINLKENRDNEIIIKETVGLNESKEDEHPLIINPDNHKEDKEIEKEIITQKGNQDTEKQIELKNGNNKCEITNESNKNDINESKKILENENNSNIKNNQNAQFKDKKPEKGEENIIYQKSEIININDDIDKDANEISNLNSEKKEISKENEIKIEENKTKIEKIISILINIDYNINKNKLKHVLEIWKNYNNQIDDDDKKVKIRRNNLENSEENKNNNKKLGKEIESGLNRYDNDNGKNEPHIVDKPKEKENNLINDKNKELLIDETMNLNKYIEDKNRLIISSNAPKEDKEIEIDIIKQKEDKDIEKEKEEQKDNNIEEGIAKEKNYKELINIDEESKQIFENENNINNINIMNNINIELSEKESEKTEENIIYQKPEINNINDDIDNNKDEKINNLNSEKNDISKKDETTIEENKNKIEKMKVILLKIDSNIKKYLLKYGLEIWKNNNKKIDEDDKKVKNEDNNIIKELKENKINNNDIIKEPENIININNDYKNESEVILQNKEKEKEINNINDNNITEKQNEEQKIDIIVSNDNDNIEENMIELSHKIRKDSDDEKKQEKIGIIETYDIDDIDEFDNDIHRLNEGKIKITKPKTKKKILTKQIINTLDSINSDSNEIKEEPNIKKQNDLIENSNHIKAPGIEKELNTNIEKEENNEFNIKEDKEILDNNNDIIQSKEKKINQNIIIEENNENNVNEEIEINEKIIKKIDINSPENKDKLLKMIKTLIPLKEFLKKLKDYNKNDIESPDIKKQIISNNINEENKIEKVYPKKNIRRYRNQKKIFVPDVQRRIKLKNTIQKYITQNPKKEIYYYFKFWKNLSNSNKETIYTSISTIHKKKLIKSKIKFIHEKNSPLSDKIEHSSQTNNTTDNIIKKTDYKLKKKVLIKLVVKKIESETNLLKKYFEIWKNNICKKEEEKEENESIEHKKIFRYKKGKLKEVMAKTNKQINKDINNEKNQKENNINIYIKNKAPMTNFSSSIKFEDINNIFNPPEEQKEIKIEDNNIDDINNEDIDHKEVIKKFILPMPNKEETKELDLLINPIKRDEDFDIMDLNLGLLDIKKAPKIPKLKSTKKPYNNKNKLIFNRHNTDKNYFGRNRNQNKVDLNSNNTDKEIELNNKYEINNKNKEYNTISIRADSSILNKDFDIKKKNNNFVLYKKIIKKEKITIKKEKNITNFDNEENIGRNIHKKEFNYEENKIKYKTFISDNVGIKLEEENKTKTKKFDLEKILNNQKEYSNNYNDLILCEEIVYKSNEAIPEIIEDYVIPKKPKKKLKIKKLNLDNIKDINLPSRKSKESLFVQRVIRYKNQERKYGYNINKSPMRLPVNPNDIELQISALSPFTKSSRNFYKEDIKRYNKFEEIIPDTNMCITDRVNQRDKLEVFTSPRFLRPNNEYNEYNNYNGPISQNSENDNYDNYYDNVGCEYNNNNIFDVQTYNRIHRRYRFDIEIPNEELKNKICDGLNNNKKLVEFHLNYVKNLPKNRFKKIQPKILYNIINDTSKKLLLLKIFYTYEKYKNSKYLIKKVYFKKWKKSSNLIDINDNDFVHIVNKYGHCLSAESIIVKEIKCGIHVNFEGNVDCLCKKIKISLIRLLIRYFYLKEIDKKKYYLYKWYKNTFGKIRPISYFLINNKI